MPDSKNPEPIKENKKETQEDEEESQEEVQDTQDSKEGIVCPKCGEPQDHYIDNPKKYGWVRCPNCGYHVRRGEIPEEMLVYEEPESEPELGSEPEPTEVERSHDPEEEEEYPPEGEEPIFRRPVAPHVTMRKVLEEYRVKRVAVDRISKRCERQGEMHPSELQSMLLDMNSGLKAREVKYCVDEYIDALEAEDAYTREAEIDRSSFSSYKPRESRRETGFPKRRRRFDSSDWSGTPWDKRRGNEPMTMSEVMKFIEERDKQRDDLEALRKKDEENQRLRDLTTRLEQKLEDLIENPPQPALPDDMLTRSDLADAQRDSLIEAMKLQLQTQNEDRKRIEDQDREDRKRAEDRHREEMRILRDEMKETRSSYKNEVGKKEAELRDEQRRADSDRKSQGYKDDGIRFAADGLHKIADIMTTRGSPIKQLGDIIPQIQTMFGPGGSQPPPRERMGPSTVADLVAEASPESVEAWQP